MSTYEAADYRRPQELLEVLANGRRRRVLTALDERSGAVSERALATELVESGQTGDDRRQVRSDLRHNHLPTLERAGLIVRDETDGAVRATDALGEMDPVYRRVLERAPDDWDDAIACLSVRRRRIVLSVLANGETPITRFNLARAVAAHEASGGGSATNARNVVQRLHHVDLPKLDAVGLVDYDPENEMVSESDHPLLAGVLADLPTTVEA